MVAALVTLLASIVTLVSWRGCSPNAPTLPIGTVDADVTLYEENRSDPAGKYPTATGNLLPYETTLKYTYERPNDDLKITYELPYLTLLSSGGPIETFASIAVDSKFTWQYPNLAVKVVNNTNRTVLLSNASIEVFGNRINKEPILVIDNRYEYQFEGTTYYNQLGSFHVINEGWGNVANASVTYQAHTRGVTKCSFKGASGSISLGSFADRAEVVIVPQQQETDCIKIGESFKYVDVSGILRYETEDHHSRAINFTTKVILGIARFQLGVLNATAKYDVMLEVEKGPYVRNFPIAEEIKPGETDYFLIQVASNKSAHFDLRLSLREATGSTLLNKNIFIDIFTPHSESRRR